MADFKQLYEEEIHYLNESGKEFGEAFPDIARYLNLEAHADRDPYVERLFEGFAFLTARIREKLEDGFPEFTRNLLEMVAPEFLKPFPSCAMLEFKAQLSSLDAPEKIADATQVLTNKLRQTGKECRFEVAKDTEIYPLKIADFQVSQEKSEGTELLFRIDVEAGIETEAWDTLKLPVFLHGDPSVSWFLYYALAELSSSISIECQELGLSQKIGDKVLLGGFEDHERLLPEGETTLSGSSLMREFFVFPEKFRYIEFPNLEVLKGKAWNSFTVKVQLNKHVLESKLRLLKLENFKLYVTPIVNLFHSDVEPIHLDKKRNQYRIIPSLKEKNFVYDVTKVIGRLKNNLDISKEYTRFHKFQHFNQEVDSCFFELRHETRKNGEQTSFLVLGGSDEKLHEEEYLSISALCTNGDLPREQVNVGEIRKSVSGFPGYINFNNITRPSQALNPVQNSYHLWNLLSHFNMNYRGLAHIDSLREVLNLFSMQSQQSTVKLKEALFDVSQKPTQRLVEGVLQRGICVYVVFKDERIDQEAYVELAQYFLMAHCLHRFFSQNISVNHYVELELEVLPLSKVFKVSSQEGTCPLL